MKLSKRSDRCTSRARTRRFGAALAGVMALPALSALTAMPAQGAVKYWDTNGATAGASAGTTAPGTWDTGTTANWSTSSAGTVATTTFAAGDQAIFSAGTNATGAFSLTISGTQTTGGFVIEEGTITNTSGVIAEGTSASQINSGAGLVIDNITRVTATAGGGALTIDGGLVRNTNTGVGGSFWTGNQGISITANGATFDVPSATGILIYNGSLTGAAGSVLTKTGVGEFRPPVGAASFSKLVVNGGLYRIQSGGVETGFGAVPAAFTADAISVNGGAIGTTAAISTNVNRGMTIGAAGADVILNASMTFGGVITGAGGLSLNVPIGPSTGTSSNILRLTAANTYAGNTTINTSTLAAAGGNAIPDTSVVILPTAGAATATFNAAASETIGNLSGGGSPANTFGNVTIGGTSAVILSVGANDGNSTYGGNVSGSGGLNKVGLGTLTIQNWDWSNTGTNSIVGGTIKFGNSAVGFSSTSTLSIGAAGTLDMNLINDTMGALSGSGAIINGGNVSLAGTQSTTFGGSYTGTGALNKNGSGILTLTSAHGFANVNLNGGRINFNNNGAGGGDGIAVANAAGIEFTSTAAGTTLANNISLAAGVNSVKVYATSGNSLTLNGQISGGGSILRDDTGAGALTLNGDNNFSGGVKVTSRGLTVGHKNAFGTGVVTIGDAVTAPATPITLQANTALSGATAMPNAVTINQNFTIGGVNDFEFSGPTDLGNGTRTITVTNTNNSILSGAISATDVGAGITKAGAGTLILGGAASNTYTGMTSVNDGTLVLGKNYGFTSVAGPITVGDGAGADFVSLGQSDQIGDASAMTMNGGTFALNNYNETLGVLGLTASSSLDMGASGTTGIVTFGDSSGQSWIGTAMLSILNWKGAAGGGGTEQVKFDSSNTSLTAPQLTQIVFVDPAGYDPGNYPATFSSTNPGEVIPLVPEPAGLATLGVGSLLMLRRRQRRA